MSEPADDLPSFSTPHQLAHYLGMSVQTVYNWRTAGHGPRAHRIGNRVRYRRSDVESWLRKRAA